MAALTIGPGATDRASTVSAANYTDIDYNGAAAGAGVLTGASIWAATNLAGCKVGVFYDDSANHKCRSQASIGAVTAGSEQSFTGLTLTAAANDVAGIFYTSGSMERDTEGYSGFGYASGDHCVVDDTASYTDVAGDAVSIYLTGYFLVSVTATDGVKVGDTPAKAVTLSPSAADGVTLGDTTVLNRAVYLTAADGVKVGDAPAGAVSVLSSASDGVKGSDAPAIIRSVSAADVPADSVVIDSLAYPILEGSLSIDNRIEERSTASFVVIDLEGTFAFAEKQPVEIYDAMATMVKQFGGFIDKLDSQRIGSTSSVAWSIECCDYHYLADKRVAAETYENTTADVIVTDLLTTYLAAEGVTIGSIEGSGVTVTAMTINYGKVSAALDVLAERANFIWWIDQEKRLYFVDRESLDAPWDYTATYGKVAPQLTEGNSQYRNRQYVKGWAVTDTQTDTFTGDGAQKSFACGYPLAKVPTVTVNSVSKTVGIKSLDTGKDFYWSKGDPVVTTETAPDSGHAVVISYQGQYPAMVLSQDSAAVITRAVTENGGTGYVEEVADESGLTDIDAVWESANAKLLKFCAESQKYVYETDTAGLYPGQFQHVTDTLLGIDQDMLIESVSVSKQAGVWTYSVTCIVGPEQGSWARLFQNLAGQARLVLDQINVGLSSTVVVLAEVSDGVEWADSAAETVYACPVVGTAVCGTSTTVC